MSAEPDPWQPEIGKSEWWESVIMGSKGGGICADVEAEEVEWLSGAVPSCGRVSAVP